MTALTVVPDDTTDRRVWEWWRGPEHGTGDHLYADCPRLAREGAGVPGVGHLDPTAGGVCADCAGRYGARRVWRLSDEY